MNRISVDTPGCEHATPIPTASRVGPLLASSVIVPFIVGTREIPDDVDEQVGNVFQRMGLILDSAQATWEQVVRITFFTSRSGIRHEIDAAWAKHFPDPASRPARSTRIATLPAGMEVQCEFLAVMPT